MSLKTADQPRWIVIVSSVIGAAATAVSIYTGMSTHQVETRLKLLEDERKSIELRTSLQLKLFEKVDSTLTALAGKSSDPETTQKRYRAASALVAGMKGPVRDDAFIGGLLQALALDAPPGKAQQEVGRIKFDAEVADEEAPAPESRKTPGRPSASSINDISRMIAGLALPAAEAASLSQPKIDLGGAAVDVFYCTSSGDGAANAARRDVARMLFDRLSTLSSRGRMRLRELPESVNSRDGYGLSSNEIRFDPPERQIADQLAKWANQGAQSLSFQLTLVRATPTPNYLSIFVCR